MNVGVVTISDRASQGTRVDESGTVIVDMIHQAGGRVADRRVVPDESELIERVIMQMVDLEDLDVVLTTGGTGLGPRDVTPEATRRVIEREVPGMAEAMRAASMQKTSRAMLSRAVAGVRGSSLIVNLPGSPKAVRECLEVIITELPHAVALLRDRPIDH